MGQAKGVPALSPQPKHKQADMAMQILVVLDSFTHLYPHLLACLLAYLHTPHVLP